LLKFAANLTLLFTEHPFLERFKAAQENGFNAVECQFPYAWPASEIKAIMDTHNLEMVLHNLPPGNFEAGERGIACLVGREDEFVSGVSHAISYAKILGVKQLNCLVGILPAGADQTLAHETLVRNLKFAAQALKAEGIRLLIEPINSFDVPGFYLNHSKQALALIDEVNSDNLFIQYDIYHMQRMEGEIASTIEKHLNKISHIQIADNPCRFEPGTGELNFPFIFKQLEKIGYAGSIGCEYNPQNGTAAGLGWLKTLTA
jgi:hydroxypyruvate isomerase